MKRIPEPEIMNDESQVLAYSNADFSDSNNLFTIAILNKIKIEKYDTLNILDLGCGPCDIDIELAKLFPNSKIYAVDGSKAMLEVAHKKILQNDIKDQIILINSTLSDLKSFHVKFDLIISKDLLHHLKNPDDLWNIIDSFSDINTYIFIMDLIRPKNKDAAKNIVEKISGNEPEILKTDFYNSLLASYTIKEVEYMLKNKNFAYEINPAGDRHFILYMKKQSKLIE